MKLWIRIKSKKFIWITAIIVGVVLIILMTKGGSEKAYEFITVSRGELVQEVSVTGKIKPTQSVDLQFESSGRISAINYKVGGHVNRGAVIASLENQDLQAAVTSARADLDKTVRNFNSLNNSLVYSSLRVELDNAENSLKRVEEQADSDLASEYNDAFNAIREAMTQINTSSVVLEYLRKTHLEAKHPWDSTVKQYQNEVKNGVNGVLSVLSAINQSNVTITPNMYNEIDLALQEALSACQSLRGAFTYLQGEVQSNSYLISSSTDRTSLNTEAVAISSDLSAISSSIRSITDQKVANNKNISDANAKLATAKAAFPASEDILEKEAALLSAQSQLRKALVVAPFAGIIGKIDVEAGQTVTSSTVIVSLISAANYQIEANITEIDIGKLRVGNQAVLTLDAYGSQTAFQAVVSAIDTSATVIEGVTTYKTIFDFEGYGDQGIRPNMTANIDIQTAKKENIISVPQRAVISKNGDRLVKIYRGDGIEPEERAVQLGMSGKDGYVEITSGLSEGEQVITFIND